MSGLIDLHVHTTASDGTCTPEEVVRMAKKKGFSLIAITDHDTMDGVKEAMEAGKKYNVEVIPGVDERFIATVHFEFFFVIHFISRTCRHWSL